MELKDYVAAYRAAREEKEQADAELKAKKEEMERAERALLDKMIEDEVPSITVGDRAFSMVTKTHYSCPAELTEELFSLLRRDGLGAIIKEKVDPRTLSSSLREIAEENDGELPADYGSIITAYEKTSISMRRG